MSANHSTGTGRKTNGVDRGDDDHEDHDGPVGDVLPARVDVLAHQRLVVQAAGSGRPARPAAASRPPPGRTWVMAFCTRRAGAPATPRPPTSA